MKRQKIQYKKNLDIIQYMLIVQQIADEYFDSNGEYQPHIGMLNTMRVFYNTCVIESAFDKTYGHEITDAMDMEAIVADSDFISAFNAAICSDCGNMKFNFTNAYRDAMDIVEYKKNSLTAAVDKIKSAIFSIMEFITPSLSTENLEQISKIADDIKAGKLSAEAVVEAYGKSNRFQEVINSEQHEENVIPMTK